MKTFTNRYIQRQKFKFCRKTEFDFTITQTNHMGVYTKLFAKRNDNNITRRRKCSILNTLVYKHTTIMSDELRLNVTFYIGNNFICLSSPLTFMSIIETRKKTTFKFNNADTL